MLVMPETSSFRYGAKEVFVLDLSQTQLDSNTLVFVFLSQFHPFEA
jgi:hypothetical protein